MIWMFGLIDLDVLTYPVPAFPALGGAERVESIRFASGGPALNAAIAAAKLGGLPVGLIGHIGDDDAGHMLLHSLENAGVDTSRLHREAGMNSGICHVYVHPDGERSFIYADGANEQLGLASLPTDLLYPGDFFHVGGLLSVDALAGETLRAILQRAQRQGAFVSVDVAGFHAWETAVPALPYIDLFMANQHEFTFLTGLKEPEAAGAKLLAAGAKAVALKLGSAGSYIWSPQWSGRLPALSIIPLDTTGAGDAFAGSLIYGLAHGRPIRQAAAFANGVGALCATTLGATDGIRSYAETQQFIEASKRAAS